MGDPVVPKCCIRVLRLGEGQIPHLCVFAIILIVTSIESPAANALHITNHSPDIGTLDPADTKIKNHIHLILGRFTLLPFPSMLLSPYRIAPQGKLGDLLLINRTRKETGHDIQ
jgi:hypothetical protein